MTFRPEDIEIVRTDEIGESIPGACRKTVRQVGEEMVATDAPVYHRKTYDTGYHPPTRCTHVFKDGHRCTFTQGNCPGHKERSWAEYING